MPECSQKYWHAFLLWGCQRISTQRRQWQRPEKSFFFSNHTSSRGKSSTETRWPLIALSLALRGSLSAHTGSHYLTKVPVYQFKVFPHGDVGLGKEVVGEIQLPCGFWTGQLTKGARIKLHRAMLCPICSVSPPFFLKFWPNSWASFPVAGSLSFCSLSLPCCQLPQWWIRMEDSPTIWASFGKGIWKSVKEWGVQRETWGHERCFWRNLMVYQ